MVNYADVQRMTDQGINSFANGGSFDIITSKGTIEIVNGEEVSKPEVRGKVTGAIRGIEYKYIDGQSILSGDKRGFFTNETPIENGMIIIINGEHWRVVDSRPVDPLQNGEPIAYRPIIRRVASYG